MNRGRNTAILAVLAAGARRLHLLRRPAPRRRRPRRRRARPRGKVFDKVDAAKIEEVRIAAQRRRGDDAAQDRRRLAPRRRRSTPPADQTEASGVASNLASADVQRVVDEKPKDLAAFGLAKPAVDGDLHASRATRRRARCCSATRTRPAATSTPSCPTRRACSWSRATSKAPSTRARSASATRRVLAFDREKVDRIDVAAGKANGDASRGRPTPGA